MDTVVVDCRASAPQSEPTKNYIMVAVTLVVVIISGLGALLITFTDVFDGSFNGAASVVHIATADTLKSHSFDIISDKANMSVKEQSTHTSKLSVCSLQVTTVCLSRQKRRIFLVYFAVSLFIIVGAFVGFAVYLTMFDGIKVLFGDSSAVGDNAAFEDNDKVIQIDIVDVEADTETIKDSAEPAASTTIDDVLVVLDQAVGLVIDTVSSIICYIFDKAPIFSSLCLLSAFFAIYGHVQNSHSLGRVGPTLLVIYILYLMSSIIMTFMFIILTCAIVLPFIRICLGILNFVSPMNRYVWWSVKFYDHIMGRTLCKCIDYFWTWFQCRILKRRGVKPARCLLSSMLLVIPQDIFDDEYHDGDENGDYR